MSASATTCLREHGAGFAVSPRRIARRAIGKKAGFPIEFIRLTSVDSLAPGMARTNGASRRHVPGERENSVTKWKASGITGDSVTGLRVPGRSWLLSRVVSPFN